MSSLHGAGNAFAAKVAPLVAAVKTHKWKCAGLALGAASVYASYHEASKTPEGQKKIKDLKRKASYVSKTGLAATALSSYGAYRGMKKLYIALGTKPEAAEIVGKFFAGYVGVMFSAVLALQASAKAAIIEKSLATIPVSLNLSSLDGMGRYPEFMDYARSLKEFFTSGKGEAHNLLLYDEKGGTGKTYMVEALAGELQVPLLRVDTATLVGQYLGLTETNIRNEFAAAVALAQDSPQRTVILCLDNLDAIAGKRASQVHISDRMYNPVGSIIAEMENLKKKNNNCTVIVCATSKNYQRLDDALKDKFGQIIKLYNPNEAIREAVLARAFKFDKALLSWIAARTKEESMVDLATLIQTINTYTKGDPKPDLVQEIVNTHMTKYYHSAVSSAVTAADVVGGLPIELQDLLDKVANPAKYKKLRKDGKLSLPTGFLLYGPPGTGKTYTAKALAGSAGIPFFNVAASEVKKSVIGGTEGAWRDVFAQAEKAAAVHPSGMSILFIDELDALGGQRGLNPLDAASVNSLLTEIDGFGQRSGHIIVIGATNRLDAIDSALKRPGRLTCHIEVAAPSQEVHKNLFAHYLNQLVGELPDKDSVLDRMAAIAHQHQASPVACREIIKEAESQTGKAGLDVVTEEILMNALHKVLKIGAQPAEPTAELPAEIKEMLRKALGNAVPADAVPAKKTKAAAKKGR